MTPRSEQVAARSQRASPIDQPRPALEQGFASDAALWAHRADSAEAAVVSRHLRTLWGMPGVALATVGWPATRRERVFTTWHYWWQAHLLDCLVDATNRDVTTERTRHIAAVVRGLRVRNVTGWTNNYYDDMAWLALALERVTGIDAAGSAGTRARTGMTALAAEVDAGWSARFGALPWRKGSDYYNTPANGPAGILYTRMGRYTRAEHIADWLDEHLRDPQTGLIHDGIHLPSGHTEGPTFSYCQAVTLGLETELAMRAGACKHVERVQQLVGAIEAHMTRHGVVVGGSDGDGGLFNGILARYLAATAVRLPGTDSAHQAARNAAATIVMQSARAAWDHRVEVEGQPLFGHCWVEPARMPVTAVAARDPQRDLSVQLSGWLLMEAAYLVTAAGL